MVQLDINDRISLAKTVMNILDGWNVTAAEVIKVLGLPSETRTRHLDRFRQNMPLPDHDEVITRAQHLLGIADALRTTYPHNAGMGPIWLRRPHRRLTNRSPLTTMTEDGLKGLRAVRAELDCTFAWDISSSGI
jgi:hypothetical protein